MRKSLLLALTACLVSVCACAQAPNTISGLQLWLDGSDPNGTGVAPASGTAILTWVDKSGALRNGVAVISVGYTTPVYTASAINGKGTIRFTKSATQVSGYNIPAFDLRAGSNPDVTIFTVYRQGAAVVAGDQALWGADNGNWDRFFFSKLGSATNGAVSQGPVSPFLVSVANAGVAGEVRLLTAVYDGNVSGGVNSGPANGSAVYFNGQVVATFTDVTDPTNAQPSMRIGYDGDDNWYGGEIAEMIVYNRKLTDCEIRGVNSYLASKYGQTFSTPSVSASTTFLCGATSSSTLTASNSGSGYSYQWLKNGVAIGGATALTYNATTAGSYRVVAAASGCSGDTSAAVTIVAGTSAATVSTPSDFAACPGSSVGITFSGTGASYTWTNNNTATGLPASGTGDISLASATNASTAPITSTITVTPVGSGLSGYAYLPNVNSTTVSVVNLATNTVAATLTVGTNPFGVAVVPNGSRALVSAVGGNNVAVINTSTNTVVGNSPYNQPHSLVASPDGTRVYVNGYGGGGALSWIDMNSPTYASTFMGTVPSPEGLAVTPDGGTVVVASATAPGKVYIFNTTTYASAQITVGDYPQGVAITPDGRYAYVAVANANVVSVIDLSSNTITKNITVGVAPLGVAISPDGTTAYVTNAGSDNVSVISIASNTVSATVSAGDYPYGVSVSPDGSKVYVANRLGNNMTIIAAATNVPTTVAVTGSNGPVALGNFLAASYQCTGAPVSFNFTVNPKPSWNNAGFSTAICNNQGIGLQIANGGNTPGATYSWTNSNPAIGTPATGSGNSLSFTGTNTGNTSIAGNFVVTPSYTNNGITCNGNSAGFTITVKPTPNVTAPGNQSLCTGGSTAAVTFSGTVAGATYNWTNSNPAIGLAGSGSGNIPSFTATNATASPISGTITVTPTLNGCDGQARTFTITVNPQPNATFSYTGSPYCSGPGTAAPTMGGTVGTTGGTFSSTTGLALDPATGTINIATSTPGTYTVTYTLPASGGCAQYTTTASVTISAPATTTISASGPLTICNGSSVTLSVPAGATSYLWSNGATANAITVSAAGNYSVTVTSGACVATGGPVSVAVNPVPTVNAVASQNLCNGANTAAIAFAGSVGGTVYNWTNNTASIGLPASGSGNIASFAAVNNGAAPVTATIAVTPSFTNGGTTCTGTAATFGITVNPTPSVNNIASQTVCNGAPITAVPFSGAVPNTTYSWSNNTPSIGLASAGTGNIPSFTGLNNGNAPVTATITVTPRANLSGRAYVPNNTAGTVSVIDLVSGAVIGSPITVGANPFGVAVTPDRSKVFVSNTGGNSVSVIDAATNTVTATSPYNAPHGLVASPDGTRVYVNGWTDNGVSYIPTATPTTSTFITNVTQPEGMAVSADGSRLYVASSTSPGNLVVINTSTSAVVATIPVGGFPQGVALSADGSKVYVVNNGSSTVSVVNTASNTVGATIPVGSNPLGIAVSPDGSKLYVTNSGNNNVSVINTATNALSASIAVGSFPYGVAVAPDGSAVYVANKNSNNVSIINAATNAVSTVAVGNGPIALGAFTTASLQCAGVPKTFTITVNPTPTVNAVASQTVCNGANTTAVSFGGSVTGTVYNWTNSNLAIGLAAGGTGNIAAFAATNSTNAPISSTITVTPSYTNGGSTCTGTPVTFTITVNPTPTVTVPANQVLCNGAATTAVTFAGNVAGATFTWINSNPSIGLAAGGAGNIASFTAANSSSTVQTATITVTPSAAGCGGTAQSFTITVNPTPTANAVSNQTLCNGAATTAVNFSGTVSGTTYSWINSNPAIGLGANGTGNIPSFTATNNTNAPATATITVTPSAAGCPGTPITFTITVNPTASVTVPANQVLCNGATTSAVSFTGPVSGTTYSWINSAPAIGLAGSGTGSIAAFTATNGASAPIVATVTVTPSAAGCPGTPVSFTVTVNPTPTVSAVPPVTVCTGQNVAATNFSGTVAGTLYSWQNSNTAIGLAASGTGNIAPFTATNNTNAPIVATITVTPTANGCPGTAITFTITVNPLPVGTITAASGTLICQGSSVPLQVTGGTSYQWLLNGAPIAGATGATYNATAAGTYSVNITNALGCTAAAANTITTTFVAKPVAAFSFSSYCQGLPVQFTNQTGTAGAGTVTYQWNFGNGQTSTQTSPATTYTAAGNYTVQLVASPNGCTTLNDTLRKTIAIEAPLPGKRLDPLNVVAGVPTQIQARNIPNGHYSWTPTTGLSDPLIFYPVITTSQEVDYRVAISFNSGCVTVDSLLVRIFSGNTVLVPSAFSPDGDGTNDVLRPIMAGIASLKSFRIYDRMGREIFSSSSPATGWDGTYMHKQMPAETYIWVLEGIDRSGTAIRKQGQVLLVR